MTAARATGIVVWLAFSFAWGCAPRPVEAPPPPPEKPAEAEGPVRLASADIGPVDRVVVDKSERRLYLLREGLPVAWVPVDLGREPDGPKRERGDNRTPEGDYLLDWRNPDSQFHRSIHISYPSPHDINQAFARGVDPGSDIFIHGTPDPILLGRDWTTGCIAVSNEDIDLIWRIVADGTPITIQP